MESPAHPALADTSTAGDARLLETRAGSEHVVQFYEEDAFLREAVARFLAAGVIAGETLLVIATSDHRGQIEKALEDKGIDVARALQSGRLRMADARETLDRFMSGGLPDRARFRESLRAAAGPVPGRLRAFGEMVDLLWREGNPQGALRLEELWNELGQEQPLTLLCAYVMGNFFKEADGAAFRSICDQHSHVLPAESYPAGAPEDRLREVSLLQQRALALETELRRRKELEEALRAARAEAEAASQAKDEFLAMLGHELRNPLSPILTALELMKLRGDGRATREQEVIDRQTRHLIRLVDDLLDVARITRGSVELRRQVIDLRDVLAKATEIASPLLEQRRHQFEVRAPARPLRLNGDEARLSQVVANLLTNAARYTPPEGHVRLEAWPDGGELVIEVSDDGVGIAAGLLPRIFDLFVQGRRSADRSEGGLGLGLALVRSLVALHGGSVEARSDGPGQGSTFSVRLPAADLHERAVHPLPAAREARRKGKRKRVLVVDDNEDALEMLVEMLQSAGHEVQAARDGPAALALVRNFRPDVAILDIGLPAMDGYELATRLRAELGPQACLMALTGYGQESDRARSEAAGFRLHLVKPFEVSQLLETIDRA